MSEIRRSLRLSTVDAVFATVHIALTQGVFLTHYVTYMGASAASVGVIEALPFLVQACALVSPVLVRRWLARKPVAVFFSLTHRLAWIPLILLLFVDLPQEWRMGLIITTLALSNACSVIAGNAWMSWMADLVPPAIRGSYYSNRNTYMGVTSLTVLFLGSGVLSAFKQAGLPQWGFAVCFTVAILSAMLSAWFLSQQHEPAAPATPPVPVWASLVRCWRKPQLRQYIAVMGLWQGSLGLSAAFFGLHMIQDLKMGPFLMGVQAVTSSVAALLAVRLWGRVIQRVGSYPVLLASGVLIAWHVVLWLPAKEGFLLPVWVCSIMGGAAWAGFNLAAFNMPLELAGAEDRPYALAVLGIVTGLCFATTSILGGALVTFVLPHTLWTWEAVGWPLVSFHLLFIASTVCRVVAMSWMARVGRGFELGVGMPRTTLAACAMVFHTLWTLGQETLEQARRRPPR